MVIGAYKQWYYQNLMVICGTKYIMVIGENKQWYYQSIINGYQWYNCYGDQ